MTHRRRHAARVLWAGYAQHGSLFPVIPLIESLRTRGAQVLLLGPPGMARLAASLRIGFRACDPRIRYDWAYQEGRDRHGLGAMAGTSWMRDRVTAEHADIIAAANCFSPGVLLADSFVIGAGLAAQTIGMPWVSYVHYLFDQDAQTDNLHRVWWEKGQDRSVTRYAAWWNLIRASVGLAPETRPRSDAPWYRMSPYQTFLLGNPLLRHGTSPLPVYATRTSFPPWDEPAPGRENASSWWPERRAGRIRVLIANSSAWQDDAELIRSSLACLDGAPCDVVATVAAHHQQCGRAPANAALCGYVPHSRLLPDADAVVSTAGYGLVTKALWWGKPLVMAPLARDQHMVAAAVESARSGVSVSWPPSPDRVRDAIGTVTADGPVRWNARQMAGHATGFPGPDRAADMVLDLARERG